MFAHKARDRGGALALRGVQDREVAGAIQTAAPGRQRAVSACGPPKGPTSVRTLAFLSDGFARPVLGPWPSVSWDARNKSACVTMADVAPDTLLNFVEE